MIAQPIALLAPVRAVSLDERPETSRVIRDAQVTKLVHDYIVEHLGRREHQPPIEGERAAWRARAPESALPSDTDPAVLDADALSFLLRQRGNEFSCARSRLRLADPGRVEAKSRHLAQPLLHNPRPLLCEQALHVETTRPSWHGQTRRLPPRHLQSPSPRPRRPPHLDLLQTATTLAVDSGVTASRARRARRRSRLEMVEPLAVLVMRNLAARVALGEDLSCVGLAVTVVTPGAPPSRLIEREPVDNVHCQKCRVG